MLSQVSGYLSGDVHERQEKYIKDFPGGMQIIDDASHRIVSKDAKLLILDEPTSGLDVLARDELMDILHAYIEMASIRYCSAPISLLTLETCC